ncbi:hypothetical protein BGZ81_000147 [Podila clonocystis]|nr:hypothetical protein BGZ81_000147 [Podila clonocystis]
MWEDPRNKYGGRLTICPPRAQLDLVWETVLILMAGDVLDHHGEGTGAVFARRARGDRVEVWLGSDDTPESLAHIRGVLCQELAASGADELIRAAKYKKHFDARRAEKAKEQPGVKVGSEGTNTPSEAASVASETITTTKETLSFEAFAQKQKELQAQREKDRELAREREREAMAKEQERIMQLGKERLEREKERAEKDRLRDERVRAMAAAAMAASEAKHQQQLLQRQQQP